MKDTPTRNAFARQCVANLKPGELISGKILQKDSASMFESEFHRCAKPLHFVPINKNLPLMFISRSQLPHSMTEKNQKNLCRNFTVILESWEKHEPKPIVVFEPDFEKQIESIISSKHSSVSRSKNQRNLNDKKISGDDESDYLPHMPIKAAQAGVENRSLFSGILFVTSTNWDICYVTVKGLTRDVLLKGRHARNRAFHGDLVAIRLNHRHLWNEYHHHKKKTYKQHPRNIGKKVSPPMDKGNDVQATGNVVAILKSKSESSQSVVGTLAWSDGSVGGERPTADTHMMFIPYAKKIPNAVVLRSSWPEAIKCIDNADNEKAWKTMYSVDYKHPWEITQYYPEACISEALGIFGEINAEAKGLLLRCGIKHCDEFDEDVLANVREFSDDLIHEEMNERRDLRAKRIFTIDSNGARDLDDAIHIDAMPDGSFEIGVHIADVTWFVREGSCVDDEARKRCATVYLTNQNIPMLPRVLSENLCSLLRGVERLAFSVIWRCNINGFIINDIAPWFGRTVIRSCCQLNYHCVQAMIDYQMHFNAHIDNEKVSIEAPHHLADIVADCTTLSTIAQHRRSNRFSHGSLQLECPKPCFVWSDDDNSIPIACNTFEFHASHRLIEEMMLCANKLVAEMLLLQNTCNIALLRQHGQPKRKDMDKLNAELSEAGFDMKIQSTQDLQYSMSSIEDKNLHDCVAHLARNAMLRAKYYSVNEDSLPHHWKHNGLNFDSYTHFTSPIRRYADVIVHRLLLYCIGKTTVLPEIDDINAMTKKCNSVQEQHHDLEMLREKLMFVLLVRNKCVIEEAYFLKLNGESGLFFVPRLGCSCNLKLNADYIEFAEKVSVQKFRGVRHIIIEWKNGHKQRLNLFETVQVKLFADDTPNAWLQITILPPSSDNFVQN